MSADFQPISLAQGAARPSAFTARLRAFYAFRLAALMLVGGCGTESVIAESRPQEGPSPDSPLAPASGAPGPEPPPPIGASGSASADEAGPCPADMALVAGDYCLTPEHRCLEYQNIHVNGRVVPNHCVRYKEPASCFDDRKRPMRFCMDRYEWPNKKGEKPMTLVSWQSAREMCAAAGKRLCTVEEFNFACEGEEMRPFVFGFSRDASQCNFDKSYRERTYTFLAHDECMANPECRAAYEALDQRTPAGSIESCKSSDGVYDLIGNANEWVMISDGKPPHRSGIKGGWWGPVRNRCRPLVTFHDEGDFAYEVGFRCCSDPGGVSRPRPPRE